MCCTQVAGNAGRKSDAKIAICAPSYNFVGLHLRNQAMYRQSKKNVKQQYFLHMSPQYGVLRPTSGWDLLASLKHTALMMLWENNRSLLIMAALCNMAGQAIIFLPCRFFFYLSIFLLFFLAYSQPSQIGCLPYFHTWCGLSANLGCWPETCCTRLAENTGRKKSPIIRHLGTIAQFCPSISLQLRHVSPIGKKLVKQQYLPHISSQYGKLRPTNGRDRSGRFGHRS